MKIQKILGQANPAATTAAEPYTVPTLKGAVVSTISICNFGTTSAEVRIFIVNAADGTPQDKNVLMYDNPVNAKDTLTLTLGITMSNEDFVSVYSTSGDVAYSIFGVEFDQENVYVP